MKIAAIILLGFPGFIRADWPQFLGPDRNGISSEKFPLVSEFSEEGPKILWKHEVGAGFAGPIAAGDRVYVFHRLGNEARLEALSAADGRVLWTHSYPTTYRDSFGFDDGPRSSPTLADGRIFSYGAEGEFHAVKASDGSLLWKRNLTTEASSPQGFFGRCGAPLAAGTRVLAQPGGTLDNKPAAVLAMDAATGKTQWQAGNQEAGYASPTLWSASGNQIAVFFLREGLLGIHPDSGKILFDVHHRSEMDASVNAASPVLLSADRFLTSACYGVGATSWKWDGSKLDQIWHTEGVLDCHYGTPVFSNGNLFGFHGRQESGTEFHCVDAATGKLRWASPRLPIGEVILADDKLLILTEKGELILAKASAERWDVLSRGQILGAAHRSPPALCGGILYARDKNRLIAVDLRKK